MVRLSYFPGFGKETVYSTTWLPLSISSTMSTVYVPEYSPPGVLSAVTVKIKESSSLLTACRSPVAWSICQTSPTPPLVIGSPSTLITASPSPKSKVTNEISSSAPGRLLKDSVAESPMALNRLASSASVVGTSFSTAISINSSKVVVTVSPSKSVTRTSTNWPRSWINRVSSSPSPTLLGW